MTGIASEAWNRAWREHPVFLPQGEDHVAAVLTVPTGQARGLVVLMTGGGGAPRSHRSAVFTRVARSLAERNIASIRIDPRGLGDSTGKPFFSLKEMPVEHTLTAARFAMRATGIDVLGMAGNCGGARATMQLFPRLPELRTAALLFVKPLAVAQSTTPAAQRARILVGRIPGVGRAAKKAYWLTKSGRARSVVEQLRSMVGRVDLLLLESDSDRAGKLLQGGYGLGSNGSHGPRVGGRRFEIREFPGGATRAFRSPERQRFAIDTLVTWFDETFPPAATTEPRGEVLPS
jgi:pimeloyl-ACP methyl ester carboxylesterase